MTSEMNRIPDHSRNAISEGCDAALLRAAFLQLEEEEIMKTRSMLNCKNHDAPERLAFARSLRRREHTVRKFPDVHVVPLTFRRRSVC